ncbi:flagellar motor protein MotB [Gluconobacter roseus]|uniref:Flagellar motor protein MotB n=1 Tax=Gluconobacter roseus NBRC 3990 TaxID=1307950 RepID=A0A4Y3M980_9PROT|nr:flagellar motor protein MotB [Gluconobacter roseus]KXV43163.1 chemotaxis protein MotB [Gluconobacter roseus]GBR43041.1 chemotaxis protein MotB [Gluconobacter roseus NBRC 3990]GEB03821.1 flagellar motor protein MotB [Gluconobacter roseus NBRC 3990]GLP94275.1 flagellar motor protein MotB [Gluconobacter roseus NBRC 3990]
MSNQNGKEARKIIIKRFDVVEGGHHGGAWKIAYADFVTAMMAFFLVMWLINATTEEQRKGIANFFNPMAVWKDMPPPMQNVLPAAPEPVSLETKPIALKPGKDQYGKPSQGASTQQKTDPAKAPSVHTAQIVVLHDNQIQPGEPPVAPASAKAEQEARVAAAKKIQTLVSNMPELADIRSQVSVTVGDDGLHIQIADSDHLPMFAMGQSSPDPHAVKLLKAIVPYLEKLPGKLSIAGYTDAAPYRPGQLSNWSLSSARAVAVRDLVVQSGFPDGRLKSVSGYADRNLFDPAQPLSPRNRRIVLVLSPDISQ